jgi:hypothetical protein
MAGSTRFGPKQADEAICASTTPLRYRHVPSSPPSTHGINASKQVYETIGLLAVLPCIIRDDLPIDVPALPPGRPPEDPFSASALTTICLKPLGVIKMRRYGRPNVFTKLHKLRNAPSYQIFVQVATFT